MIRCLLKFVYNGFWHLVLLGWLLFRFIIAIKGQESRNSLWQRLAIYPNIRHLQQPVIWFHASSLGEVLALLPLMKQLRGKFSHSQVLSVSTVRGDHVARQKQHADQVLFLPLDICYLVQRALKTIAPTLIVVFETEIWPNLFWQCQKRNIPLLLISGRISPRSFARYRLAKFFFAEVLQHGLFLMQTREDAQRIIAIGAPPEKVSVSGNIKFDGLRYQLAPKEIEVLQQNFPGQGPVLVAGSTHDGEEEIVIDVYCNLQKTLPQLKLILAPRHLRRLREVISLLKARNLRYNLRSQVGTIDSSASIIVLDTYGELSRVYWLADVVFLGGSLAPIGGHNLMEPAAFAKPIVCGPHMFNFRQQLQLFTDKAAVCIAKTPAMLEQNLLDLLLHPTKAAHIGKKAQEVVLANRGAIDFCISRIQELCPISS